MTPPAPHRRWFRYSLGTLFWLTLVVAMFLFALNEHRERKQFEAEVGKRFNGVDEHIRKLMRQHDWEERLDAAILSGDLDRTGKDAQRREKIDQNKANSPTNSVITH